MSTHAEVDDPTPPGRRLPLFPRSNSSRRPAQLAGERCGDRPDPDRLVARHQRPLCSTLAHFASTTRSPGLPNRGSAWSWSTSFEPVSWTRGDQPELRQATWSPGILNEQLVLTRSAAQTTP